MLKHRKNIINKEELYIKKSNNSEDTQPFQVWYENSILFFAKTQAEAIKFIDNFDMDSHFRDLTK